MYDFSKDAGVLLITLVAYVMYFEDMMLPDIDDNGVGEFAMFMLATAAIGISYDMLSAGYIYLSVVLCGLYTIFRIRDIEVALKK